MTLQWRGVAAQLARAQAIVARSAACSLPAMVVLAAIVAGMATGGTAGERLRAVAVAGWVSIIPTASLIVLVTVTRQPLGLAAMMIGAIAVGIAVDDILHVISALRRRGTPVRAALECWRPCVGSSIVAASSLALFLLCPFGPTRQFGLLMGGGLLLGLVANQLFVLPLLRPQTADPIPSRVSNRTDAVTMRDYLYERKAVP